MEQGAPYTDANVNQFNSSQMQHISAQRMRQNSGINSFPGRPNSFLAMKELPYASNNTEGQWQWDRDAQRMSPGLHSEGQGRIVSRSFYRNQNSDPKVGSNEESRVHTQEEDMEIGYEDDASAKTLETLEQKFLDDITKLTKEHVDAEDAENAQHREKIIKINEEYQEQLSGLRARHASRREEFLLKEAQLRFQQYQHVGINHHQNNNNNNNNNAQSDIGNQGFGGPPAPGGVPAEAHRPFSGSQFDSYLQHPESFGRGREHGADARVPAAGGRAYNSAPRYY
ncbi:hypothetical protein Dimus_012441 [Dionaea muscipula]